MATCQRVETIEMSAAEMVDASKHLQHSIREIFKNEDTVVALLNSGKS